MEGSRIKVERKRKEGSDVSEGRKEPGNLRKQNIVFLTLYEHQKIKKLCEVNYEIVLQEDRWLSLGSNTSNLPNESSISWLKGVSRKDNCCLYLTDIWLKMSY